MNLEDGDKTVGRVGENVRFFVFQHLPRGLHYLLSDVHNIFRVNVQAVAYAEIVKRSSSHPG